MANVDFPFGFEPIRYQNGRAMTCEYLPVSSTNSAIGFNDPLERGSDGYLTPATASSTTVVGIAAQSLAANTGGNVAYFPIEGLICKAQVDDASVDAQTDFDLTYGLTVGTPDSLTGRSTFEIDGSTGASSATLPVKLTKVWDSPNQYGNALGANVVVECMFNNGPFKGAGIAG